MAMGALAGVLRSATVLQPLFPSDVPAAVPGTKPELHFCRSEVSIFGVICRLERATMLLSLLTAVGLTTRAMVGIPKVAEQFKLRKDHTHVHCVTASDLHVH